MDWITEQFSLSPATQTKLFGTLIVVVVALLLRYLIGRVLHMRLDDTEAVYRTSKLTTYALTVVSSIALAWIWIDAFDNLATYLAVVSAGLAIALADVLKDMAGWVYVLVRRPFRVGDRIEIDGTKGDVIDLRLFRFTVAEVGNWVDAEQATGRLIHIPNGGLFTTQLANYTEGFEFVWHEMAVLITFESDWHLAEERFREIAETHSPEIEAEAGARIRKIARNYNIKLGVLRPTVYLSVRDSGVLLTLRFLTDPRERRGVEERIWRAILETLDAEPTIELAYPTVRGFLRDPIGVASQA